MIPSKTIQLLDKIALMSDHPQYQHGAAVIKRNAVLGVGCNRMKTHPMQARFGKNGDAIFLHAEINAIKNALKTYRVSDLTGSTLIVLRRTTTGFGMSKPCVGCTRAVIEFDFKTVIYSTETEFVTLGEHDVRHEHPC